MNSTDHPPIFTSCRPGTVLGPGRSLGPSQPEPGAGWGGVPGHPTVDPLGRDGVPGHPVGTPRPTGYSDVFWFESFAGQCFVCNAAPADLPSARL